jgi:DNA-binding transcriptional ArsR family regulator
MDRDHELSAVLADDTRYHIYRAVAERPGEDVTVADIAGRFGLHPNVARMHLAKLEQAGFLATDFRRTSGGGRPAKLYRLSDLVVSFAFPPRRYELLSRLALDSLAAGGSREDALRVCLRQVRPKADVPWPARPARHTTPLPQPSWCAVSPKARACCPRCPGTTRPSRSWSTTAPFASSPGPIQTSSAPCTAPFSKACSRS